MLHQASSSLKVIAHQDTKVNGYCRTALSPELSTLKPLKLQLGFPIGSPYAAAFAEYIYTLYGHIKLLCCKFKTKYFQIYLSCEHSWDGGTLEEEKHPH